ncbi:MAG: pseudouridine-5'-phosphate glycosidase [Gemmatimonadota bacterium]|nr:pseudouridine-5'-phosphate glycosidase [Gemmatimonadota bacterium]
MTQPPVVDHLEYSAEVHDALSAGEPVVALESTIISHGMPYPQNVATARELEAIVRDAGAVPATIAVLHGTMKVGLDATELEFLATSSEVQKISIRDLPLTVALGQHGATTVATTMRIASLAGIEVFATGGTGGVHRGGAMSLDVSADLFELQRTSVAVVSAGVKSILDIGLTLEKLETLGIPVIGYRTSDFPAFFSRQSGYRTPSTVDSPEQIARILRTKWRLGMSGGVLIANPIPGAAEIPASEIDPIISAAVGDMERLGIGGKDATPYLLGRIVELTGGRSLAANIALVRNNAKLAGEIASALRDA